VRKRVAEKWRENLPVWLQLLLLAARSRPEAEPNRGNICRWLGIAVPVLHDLWPLILSSTCCTLHKKLARVVKPVRACSKLHQSMIVGC
jgi:hypothetical protein